MSDKPLLLYLHVPKTGGSTLTTVIYEQYHDGTYSKEENGYFTAGVYYMPGGFEYRVGDQLNPDALRIMRRPDANAVLGHFYFGLHEQLQRPTKYMTILRDPARRVRSLYLHLKQYNHLPAGMTLTQFVETPHIAEARNDQVRRISGAAPGLACDERDLERAKENLTRHIDFVGTTERYDASILLAQRIFGWTEPITYLPQLVNTALRDTPTQDTDEMTRVREQNYLDVQLYDYASRLLDERIAAQGESFPQALADYQRDNERLLKTYGPASTIC